MKNKWKSCNRTVKKKKLHYTSSGMCVCHKMQKEKKNMNKRRKPHLLLQQYVRIYVLRTQIPIVQLYPLFYIFIQILYVC